jgi:hypothetical protein
MPPDSPFVVKIERDTERQGRFRWRVFQDGIMRDASVYSFATKRQAQVDGDKFVKTQQHMADCKVTKQTKGQPDLGQWAKRMVEFRLAGPYAV